MFKCQECKKQIGSGQASFRVITEIRNKEYENEVFRIIEGERVAQKKFSKGWEIKKEKQVCKSCNETLNIVPLVK